MDPSAMIRMRTDEILRDKIALGMYGGARISGMNARNKNGTYKKRCRKGTLKQCVKKRGTGDLIGGAKKYNRVCPKGQTRRCSKALWKKRNGGIMAGEGIMAGCCDMCMGSGCDMCMGSGMDYGTDIYGGRCQTGYRKGCKKYVCIKNGSKTTMTRAKPSTKASLKKSTAAKMSRWHKWLKDTQKNTGVSVYEIINDPSLMKQVKDGYHAKYG